MTWLTDERLMLKTKKRHRPDVSRASNILIIKKIKIIKLLGVLIDV